MSRPSAVLVLDEQERKRLNLPATAPADPIGSWRTVRARLLTWADRHRTSLLLVTPLLLITAVVRFWGMSHGPALADDEGTYLAQAWAVQREHQLAPYTYWYDHPPFGWLQLAVWTWVTGTFSHAGLAILAGRRLMVLYAVADAGLLYVLARRLRVRRPFAALAVLAWALSPLAVGMSRMVYLDNLATPWVLGAFVLAASPRRDLWAYVGSGFLFAGAVLSKETTALLLPGLVLLLWQRTVRQTRTFCMTGFGAGFLLLGSAYPLLALLKGELLPGSKHVSLYDALRYQLVARPSTGSPLDPHSVSRLVVDGWLRMDDLLVIAGLLAIVPVLLVRRYRPVGVALGLLVLSAIRPGYLPEPLVIVALPFCALAVGATVDTAWTWATRPRVTRAWAGLRATAVLAAVTALVAVAVPSWVAGNRALAAVNHARPTQLATAWLEQHRPPGRLLVDDTLWADLASHGYPPDEVVWFYKLDFVNNLDPSVRQHVHGWQDFGIVVVTPVVRHALYVSPTSFQIVREAVAHARVIATFGGGNDEVQVLAVQRPAPPPARRP